MTADEARDWIDAFEEGACVCGGTSGLLPAEQQKHLPGCPFIAELAAAS